VAAVKAVVIILAILIVIALGAVLWAIVGLRTPADNPPVASRQDPMSLSLALPPACAIADFELDGRRLAVRAAGPAEIAECQRIYIVDLGSGQVVTTVAP